MWPPTPRRAKRLAPLTLAFTTMLMVNLASCDEFEVFRTRVIIEVESTGKLLSVCSGCARGSTVDEVAFAHVHNPGVVPLSPLWSQWDLVALANGKFALYSPHAKKYLGRCRDCSKVPGKFDVVATHVDDPQTAPGAQFALRRFEDGTVAFKSNSGEHLALCPNCWSGTPRFPDIITVHVWAAESGRVPEKAKFRIQQLYEWEEDQRSDKRTMPTS